VIYTEGCLLMLETGYAVLFWVWVLAILAYLEWCRRGRTNLWKSMPKNVRLWFFDRKMKQIKRWVDSTPVVPDRALIGFGLVWADHYAINS